MLADPTATMLVVQQRDRQARLGVEHLQAALVAQGRRLVVVDPASGETSDELWRAMLEVLTSLCARLGHVDPSDAGGERR